MTYLQSVVMALVQGITEFLPVSSSGHLVLTKSLLGVNSPGALYEVALHMGTLAAVMVVFWRDLRQVVAGFCSSLSKWAHGTCWTDVWKADPNFRMGCYIILGTAPIAAVGMGLGWLLERLFSQPILSAAMIFVTGEILWLSRPHSMIRSDGKIQLPDSLAIGAAQAAALVPGISRSGITIATGMIIGINREQAARFSFLLFIPAILGVGISKTCDAFTLPNNQILPLFAGMAVAGVSGYIALRILLRIVKAGRLHCFAYYCWAASVFGVTYLLTMA